MNDLLPCPFCGGQAEMACVPRQVTWTDNDGFTKEGAAFARLPAGHRCYCSTCGAVGKTISDDHEAVRCLHSKLRLKRNEYVLCGMPGAAEIQAEAQRRAADAWNTREPLTDG